MKHSLFSPSAAHRWINCPASIRLKMELNLPEPPKSAEALEGEAAHSQAAWALKHRMASIGDPAIDLYLDTVLDALGQYSDAEMFIEKRVEIVENCWGTVDCAIWSKSAKQLHVFDYKHGKGVLVEVEDNPQLKLYWYGLAKQLGAMQGSINIVQPRHWSNEPPVRIQEVDLIEVETWVKDQVIPAMNAVEKDAPHPGKWCRWCPVMVGCPAIKDVLEEDIKIASSKKVEALTADEAERLYRGLEHLTEYKKALEAFVAQKLVEEDSAFLAHFKFVKTPNRWIWADEKGLQDYVELLGEDVDKLFEKKIISPSKAGKIFKDIDLKPYIRNVGGNPKVALLDATGEEYHKPKPEEDFDIIR